MIFNQPEITKVTFKEIRKSKPKRLFVSADGPRFNNDKDKVECKLTRDVVMDNIDWECEVSTRFLNENIGVKRAVSSAITWFLDEVEEGIILEYDCVPSQSFFWFCQELLEKYRYDTRVMAINGSNFRFGDKNGDASYYFSKIPAVWGWATWKRAWKYWDGDLVTYKELKAKNLMKSVFNSKESKDYWVDKFEQIINKKDTTWGHPWCYAVMSQNGVCINTNINFISNIGFTDQGTHAKDKEYVLSNLERYDIDELVHPSIMLPDVNADEEVMVNYPRASAQEKMSIFIKAKILSCTPSRYHNKLKQLYKKVKGNN